MFILFGESFKDHYHYGQVFQRKPRLCDLTVYNMYILKCESVSRRFLQIQREGVGRCNQMQPPTIVYCKTSLAPLVQLPHSRSGELRAQSQQST